MNNKLFDILCYQESNSNIAIKVYFLLIALTDVRKVEKLHFLEITVSEKKFILNDRFLLLDYVSLNWKY